MDEKRLEEQHKTKVRVVEGRNDVNRITERE